MRTRRRLPVVDALRGMALLGIAQMNLPAFLLGFERNFSLLWFHPDRASWLAWGIGEFFISAKFYPIFAFLFGYGFVLQWRSLVRNGHAPRRVLARRYLILLVIGILHGSLLFFGDILTIYALAGLVLVMQGIPSLATARKTVVIWALVALTLTFIAAFAGLNDIASASDDPVGRTAAALVFATQGSVSDILQDRAWLYVYAQRGAVIYFLPLLMFFFGLGGLAARQGLLLRPERHRAFWKKMLAGGLIIGIPVNLAMLACDVGLLSSPDDPLLSAGTDLLDQFAFTLSFAWVAGVVLLSLRGTSSRTIATIFAFFGAAGRVALTNYLTQSILMVVFIGGIGFGWGRGQSPFALSMIALLVALAQIGLSPWYLRRFGRGPFESAWRRLTYGRAVPVVVPVVGS